jgi:C4-type Zn-finger protein|mmetsp:Transcript_43597/g.118459  ORF Transcript_43597/g.118459 Transcript_43597/m.118459 type:complete len:130 (+) Transcript_43597:2187-2576(+)
MVGDRTEAVHKVQRARNEVENSEQRLQRTKRQNIDNSTKVAVALEQLRTAKQQHTNATLRLSAMSANSYKREVEWCDEERVRDMASHLREFVQLQRQQAELAQNAFRFVERRTIHPSPSPSPLPPSLSS